MNPAPPSGSASDPDTLASFTPWDEGRPTIYDFLKAESQKAVGDGIAQLPDASYGQHAVPWPGEPYDEVKSSINAQRRQDAVATFEALKALQEQPSRSTANSLYETLLAIPAYGIELPHLLSMLVRENLNPAFMETVALWLATTSPDREPVKVAVAMLGVFEGQRHTEVLRVFAIHEEFSHSALMALDLSVRDKPQKDLLLFEIAKLTSGWAKHDVLQYLNGTENLGIKRWMIAEGYKDAERPAEVAYACATSGDLVGQLRRSDVDDELLDGAGTIIATLAESYYTKDMEDYRDGSEAAAMFLSHLRDRPSLTSTQLSAVRVIADLGSRDYDHYDWNHLATIGWSNARCEEIVANARRILDRAAFST